MATHGKQRTAKQIARHYAKPSRANRYAKRWDARVTEMREEFNRRAAAEALRVAAEATTPSVAA